MSEQRQAANNVTEISSHDDFRTSRNQQDETIKPDKSFGVASDDRAEQGVSLANETVGQHAIDKERIKMSNVSREEIAARIDASEANTRTAIADLRGEIRTNQIEIKSLIENVATEVKQSKAASEKAETAADDAKKAAGDIKWNILFAALGTLGILLAAWAIWVQGMELVGGLIERAS